MSPSSLPTSPPVVSPVPCLSPSSTLLTSPEPDSPTTPRVMALSNASLFTVTLQARTASDSSTVSSTSTRRPSPPTVSLVSTEVSPSPALVSSSTEVTKINPLAPFNPFQVFTSVFTIPSSPCSSDLMLPSWSPSSSDGVSHALKASFNVFNPSCYRCLWPRFLPHRYRPTSNDDDLRNRCFLQILP